MLIHVFGNPDLEQDSLPLKILPKLKKRFPNVDFIVKDPNEDWEIFGPLFAIDTVVGIKKITLFNDFSIFERSPRNTMHDFDAYANIALMRKIGKIKEVMMIGIPPSHDQDKALNETNAMLRNIVNYPVRPLGQRRVS